MPETYDEIIEEIKTLAEEAVRYPTILYRDKYELGGSGPTESYEIGVLKHLCARIREAVGGDPTEWWVECNGERVYVGDNVQVPYDNDVYTVIGFSHLYEDNPTVFLDRRTPVPAKDVHKVVPDTREKIIEDALDELTEHRCLERFTGAERAIITKAIDRAIKLGAE